MRYLGWVEGMHLWVGCLGGGPGLTFRIMFGPRSAGVFVNAAPVELRWAQVVALCVEATALRREATSKKGND